MSLIDVRTANESDCFLEIAECIYATDPFIYPTAFGHNKEKAVLAISKLIRIPGSLLHYSNIFVAVKDNSVCGVLLYNEHGAEWNTEQFYLLTNEFLEDKQKFEYASNTYFEEESKQPEDNHIEIIAVCVAPEHRGKGIASKMLSSFIEIKANKILELDVLANNESAIRLYSRCGFQITAQYKGFSYTDATRPDCYHMVRDC